MFNELILFTSFSSLCLNLFTFDMLHHLYHLYLLNILADYGTSQAAKRSLFKFGRLGDFEIFRLDQEEDEEE